MATLGQASVQVRHFLLQYFSRCIATENLNYVMSECKLNSKGSINCVERFYPIRLGKEWRQTITEE